jgi:hypothetical protein
MAVDGTVVKYNKEASDGQMLLRRAIASDKYWRQVSGASFRQLPIEGPSVSQDLEVG